MSKKSKEEKKIDKIRENYLHQLRVTQGESIKQFDAQILYISSGAVLLSITFLGDVIKLDTAVGKVVLIVSWITLVLTIVVSVLSHLISYRQHDKAIERIEKDQVPLEDKLSRGLNISVAALFLIGISSLISFAIINIYNMKTERPAVPTQKPAPTNNIHLPQVGSTETLGNPVAMAPAALVNPKPKR